MVCLYLGDVNERRPFARQFAHDLLSRADRLMYDAKAQGVGQISPVRARLNEGVLEEMGEDEHE